MDEKKTPNNIGRNHPEIGKKSKYQKKIKQLIVKICTVDKN